MNANDPAHISGVAAVVSSGTSITLWGMSVSELGVIISACVAVATLIVHVWYTLRKDRRAAQLHKLRLSLSDPDAEEG